MSEKQLKTHSIRHYILKAILTVGLPLAGLLIVLFLYTTIQTKRRTEQSVLSKENVILASFGRAADYISQKVDKDVMSSSFLYFTNSYTYKKVFIYGNQLYNRIYSDIWTQHETAGIALTNDSCDYVSKYAKNTAAKEALSDIIRRDEHSFGISPVSTVRFYEFGGQLYLVKQVSERFGSVYILIAPSLNPEYQSLLPDDKTESLSFRGDSYTLQKKDLVTSASILEKQLSLVYQNTEDQLTDYLDKTQIVLFFVIFVALLLVPITILILRKNLISPLLQLSDNFDQLQNADENFVPATDSSVTEIRRYYDGFNEMLDNIRIAEAQRLESKMDATQAKLQYLQMQIRPHFYLNCLKNIYSLAEVNEVDKIKELTLYLSEYFRYSFQDVKNFLPLIDELNAVQSYINLSNCMAERVHLNFELDSDAIDTLCLPITILTFVENSIKHGKNQEDLQVTIAAKRCRNDTSDNVIITISDNGNAMEPEEADKLNQADPSKFIYRSTGVGVSNVKYRLWLVYREQSSVIYSVESGQTNVQITFPYMKGNESS